MSDYVLSATLELKDKLTAKINDAKKGMDSFKSSASGVSGSLDAAQGAMAKTGLSAVKAAADTDRLKRSLQGVKGNYAATVSVKDNLSAAAEQVKGALQGIRPSYSVTLSAKDEASRVASGAKNTLQGIRGIYSATISAKDNASAVADKAQGKLQGIRNSYTASIFAKDNATSVIGKVKTGLHDVSRQYSATITAKDDASGVVGRVRSGLQGLQGRAASTSVHLRDEASAGIARVKEELTGLTGKAYTAVLNFKQNTGGLSGMGEKAAGMVSGVANGMLMNTSMQMAGAAGIGFGIYDTIKSYTDFEAQMKKVQAIADVSQDDFSALTEKAKEMGAITQFSATQAGQGLEYMAMAGWKTDQMLSGLPGIMNLAAASGEDLGRVSDIVTDALSAFGLQAEDSAHFADVLAKAATNSNTNVGLMGETFKYVAPIAGALKYSVEDVGLAIGLMANSGIKASEAGTSLRSIFVRMSAPPADAAKALNALGVSIKNTDGTVKPFRQTMLDLRKAFAGLSEVDKADFASKIAGQEAMSGLLAIVNASDSDFEKLEDAMDHSDGAAAKAAATMNDNLKGALVSLSSAWESFQIEIMSGKAGEGIRSFVEGVRDDVTRFKDYIKDGLDISDVGHIAADVITQLKNKFLELDGIGSVLAGGALAFGLYKIIGLTKKAVSAVKDLFSARAGKSGGASAGGATAAREIVINASSVVVNGKSVVGAGGGKAGGPVPVPSGGRNTPAPVPAGGWRSAAISVAKGGALAALFAGLDIYSTHSENQQKLAEAASGLDAATDNLKNLRESGASQEEIQIAEQGVEEAKQYQADTQSYADLSMDQSVGSGIGGIIGAGIGGALMGPVGMAVGGFIGSVIGDKIGERFHTYASNDLEAIKKEVEPESKADDYDRVGMGEEPEMPVRVVAPDADDVTQAVQDTEDKIADVNLTDLDDNAGIGLWQSLFGDTSAATNACSEVQSTVESSNDAISDDASETSSELSSYAEESSSYMSESYSDSADNTESAWSGVVSWFQSNVWGPLVQGAASAARQMANYISQAAASARSSGHTTIASGLDWVGNNLAWLGGGSYEHRASGASYYSGGWTEINEQGGEIVDLPRGSRIYPHATTIRMLKEMFEDSRPQTLQTVLPKAEMPEPVMNVAVPKAEMPEPVYKPVLSVPSLSGMLDDMAYPPEPSQPMGMQPEPAYQPELPSQQIVVNTSRDSTPASAQPPTINITGNSFTVREEADIDRIAYRLMQLIQKAQSNMNYVGQGAFV